MKMASGPAVRGRLTRSSRSIRAVLRCLTGSKESQDVSNRTLLLLCELQDLICRLQDQLTWAEEKWIMDPSRLLNLNEVLGSLESTIEAMDIYFQPGGVSARLFRKRLLENTFIPRLEQFKIMMILTMQPGSTEKNRVEEKLRVKFRQYQELDSDSIRASTPRCEDYDYITSQSTTKSFMRLADLIRRRQKGTCEWIFDHETYNKWLFGSSRILYCVGPAGAGKTFLASTIIDNLQKTFTSAEVAVVFIFGQDEIEEGNALGFLDKILAQLVYRKRTPSHATVSLYKSESFQNGRASTKAFQDAIRAEVNRFSRVFFVVDGIETSSEKDRILNRLQKLPDHAQLLVMMREAKYDSKDEQLSVLAIRDDLEAYIANRINEDERLTSLLKEYPSELKTAVVQQVVKKCHGLFLLARLHMDLLSRCTDGSLLQRALFHLPESLNDAYGESMTRIVSQNPHASRCLFWTLYACRPLTVPELNFAASFEPLVSTSGKSSSHPECSMIHETAGLLSIDTISDTVQLVHRTAGEYLDGPAARVFFPTAKKHIAETCLTIITSDEVVDECYMTRGLCPRESKNYLLDYAITYWGDHAREVNDDEQTTQVLIRAFLNKLCWRRPPLESSYVTAADIPKHLGLGSYFVDWSALHVLAYFGILGKARRLIEQDANINECENELGVTPLHCAVHRGHEEMVDLLIEQNADVNATSKDGNTALHIAAELGHRKLIKTLLNRRINSRIANSQGATALQLAVGTAFDEATVPLLIKSRFDMDVQNAVTGNTALHLAVELKRPRILLFLIEKGANLNILNREGLTPLQLACKLDNCEAVSLLLERGAKLETSSSGGNTAIHISASEGNWICFDLLVTGGADINAWNSDGDSLLHEHAQKGGTLSITAHLLENGANIEACNSQGYTPLQCAALSGNKTIFLYLVDEGANTQVHTAKGETLLHITPPLNQNYLDILIVLLSLNINPNAVTCSGLTPIHNIIINHLDAIDLPLENVMHYISLLLSRGANINAQLLSHKSETALHLAIAAKTPQEPLLLFLINSGASLDVKTIDGRTPLHLAVECGRNSILTLLLNAGADPMIKAPSESPSSRRLAPYNETTISLTKQNTAKVLQAYEAGKTLCSSPDTQRDSITTDIDALEIGSDTDGIGGSTLVGEDGSIWGSRVSSTSMSNPSILSSS